MCDRCRNSISSKVFLTSPDSLAFLRQAYLKDFGLARRFAQYFKVEL